MTHKQYFYAAKDNFYPSFSGSISALKVQLCDGAFTKLYTPGKNLIGPF